MTVDKRELVLLDVDNTLIFGQQNNIKYNDNLINTLLENDVKDVYLFTSMTLKKRTIRERIELINYLKSQGLTVHGLICASDLVWNKDKNLLNQFYTAATQTSKDDEVVSLLSQDEYQSLTYFDGETCGQAFSAVSNQVENMDEGSKEYNIYQDVVAPIRLYLNSKNDSLHKDDIARSEKSYMYEMFVRNKPDWVGDVIFVDDSDVHTKGVSAMHSSLQVKHKLLTVLNCNQNGTQKNIKENTQDFYHGIINPFLQLIRGLHTAFNSYKSGRKLTYSAEKNIILEEFKTCLENCQTIEEVQNIEVNFVNAYYQKLNSHRFNIFSNGQTRSIMAFQQMATKRQEQLQFDLVQSENDDLTL